MIERIYAPAHIDGGEGLLAIVVRGRSNGVIDPPGIQFITERDNPLQLGVINYSAGQIVQAHVHLPNKRTVELTQEVLFVRKGTITVNIFTGHGDSAGYVTLSRGDVILLVAGGHSVIAYDSAEVIEIKQGPYSGKDRDKVEFPIG
jgi:hypothetical protein